MRSGLLGKARAALENVKPMGVLRRLHVRALGDCGEVTQAVEGSVTAEMLSKHPQHDHPVPSLQQLLADAAPAGVTPATVASALAAVDDAFGDSGLFHAYVRSLHGSRGSMPACDGVRVEHVLRLAKASDVLLAQLHRWCLCLLKGQVPAAARPFIYGARLVAPAKPDEGHRPLGAGFVMRRVAFGFAARCVRDDVAKVMAPEQLGPVRDGCLRFAATVRSCLEAHPDWVLCKLDFRNAFNECDRAAFLSFVAAEMPCLLPLCAAYGAPVFISALGPDVLLTGDLPFHTE